MKIALNLGCGNKHIQSDDEYKNNTYYSRISSKKYSDAINHETRRKRSYLYSLPPDKLLYHLSLQDNHFFDLILDMDNQSENIKLYVKNHRFKERGDYIDSLIDISKQIDKWVEQLKGGKL